jgi:K+-sensing histidine kinase KdpD
MGLKGAGDRFGSELAAIDRQVRRMTGLVDDLMDSSRIARGVIELRRRVVEVSEIVAGGIEVVRAPMDLRWLILEQVLL